MAKKSARTKRKVTKKNVAPKAKAARSSSSRSKATKHSAKRSTRPSVKRRTKRSTKHTVKPAVRRRTKRSSKPTVKPAVKQSTKVTARTKPQGDFDFNTWLLPTLELERYEPNITSEMGVQDRIKGSTRYAWIGAGQCGGRIAKSFYDLGYRKVLAVNTTHHDLDLLEIPKNQKFLMDIGEKGAGKDMERGREAVQQYQQEILHMTRQIFGTEVDHIMVCFGAGGGTGGGSAAGLIEIAKRYARYIGLSNPDKKVGVMMTLPTVGEASSPLVAQNAHDVARELSQIAAKGKISLSP